MIVDDRRFMASMGLEMIVSILLRLSGPRASRTGAAGARHSSRIAFRPGWISLEPRITPTGHVAVTDTFLVNAGERVANVSSGQPFDVQADVTTRGLPAHAGLWVSVTVNGLTRSTPLLDSSVVHSGIRSWSGESANFIASPGTNQVTITVHRKRTPADSPKANATMSFGFDASSPSVASLSYSVSQIRTAYGINPIPWFGSARPDGSGQTIAIVDAYNDPNIIKNLQGFDELMHLSTNSSPTLFQRFGPASSILTVYNQRGSDITAYLRQSGDAREGVPQQDPSGNWQREETLDVEWAHAIAPAAKIDVVECDGNGPFEGLYIGAATAAKLPGVSVVSMSWTEHESSSGEIDDAFEQAEDLHTFVTPKDHRGVTFMASAGDDGAPAGYPANSPNVVAVGGTDLTVKSGVYGGESGWSFQVARTLEHGRSSYSQTGTWSSRSGGYSGTYGVAAAGSDSLAKWTTTIGRQNLGHNGGVEVSATWVVLPTNATSVTYSIYNTAEPTGNPLWTETVDQARPPVGTSVGSADFQDLGVYYPALGSTLTVTVSANSAKGTVVADAIGVAPALATGGGPSRFEPEPSYQRNDQSTGYRTTPDVSFDASDVSGVTVYRDGSLHYGAYGTSLSAPCWAGLIAIADQGRVARGEEALDSVADPRQTLQALYSLPARDFHDIATGYNGYSVGAGYDQVTGLGTPIASRLIPGLVAYRHPARSATPTWSIQARHPYLAQDANQKSKDANHTSIHNLAKAPPALSVTISLHP
jgi:subtilase family serine protease